MTTHTPSSHPPRVAEAHAGALPARRRRRRRDWGRALARVFCGALALIGLLPFVATLVVRSAWARDWAARETQGILRQQGVVASYAPSLRVWPLAVVLDHVRLESSDGGAPVIECSRVALRPRLFALFAGKLAIDQIDLDGPHVRAVVRDGKLANLALKTQESEKREGPFHAPFNTFSVTDGAIDLTVDSVHLSAESIDVDVTADDDPALGSSFETTLRLGRVSVERPRVLADGSIASDDDALCLVEGRVRLEPGGVLVRRFQGVGSADLDAAPNTTPPCDLPANDKRRVEISLGHLNVVFPRVPGGIPSVDGHIHARAPIALAGRLVSLPDTDGWIGVDADMRYADDTILPDLSGTIEAHDVRLDQYVLAHDLLSEVTIRRNVIESPKTTLHFAGGTLVLSETVVDPLSRGGRLQHTRLDASGVDFTALMRDLGVHPSSWVGWDLREIHAPSISGTFAPLKIDGDFTAKTYTFGVYDRPAEDHARERLFGFSEAQLAARFSVRPEALKFSEVRAILPHSRIDGGVCSIGFHDDLIVEVPHLEADLDDLSPIGNVPMRGKLQATAHVDGVFNRPKPVGDITSLAGFTVADVAFGDLTAGHVEVDVVKPEVDITSVRAKRRDSAYEVPTATLRFGGAQGFVVDAVGASAGFGMRDVLSMFALDEDPRFDGLDATMAARADVHVALGGPQDSCGGGYISVDTKGHLRNVSLYGERFAQGDAEATLRWYDRERGIAGADVDLRSFVLDKVLPPEGTRAGANGTVLGSATLRRGGALAANVMLQGVPLSRLDSLGSLAPQVGGSVSGVAHVTGNLDDALPDAGFVARAEVDVSATRVRDVAVQGSHLDLRMTHHMPQQKRSLGRTRCGAPIGPAFDAKAFLADTSSHGEWTLNGDLFGNTVNLHDVVLTRARSPHLSGRVSFRAVDLGAVGGILTPRRADADDVVAPAARPLGGKLSAELTVDDLPLDAPSKAHGRLVLGPTFVTRGTDKLTLSQLERSHRARRRRPHGAVARGDARDGRRVARRTLRGLGLQRRLRAEGRRHEDLQRPDARVRRAPQHGGPRRPAPPRAERRRRHRDPRGQLAGERQVDGADRRRAAAREGRQPPRSRPPGGRHQHPDRRGRERQRSERVGERGARGRNGFVRGVDSDPRFRRGRARFADHDPRGARRPGRRREGDVRRGPPRHVRSEDAGRSGRSDSPPDGRRDDRLARLHASDHDERELAVVRDAGEAHGGQRVRSSPRRSRARPARPVRGADRDQEQPRRGAARRSIRERSR